MAHIVRNFVIDLNDIVNVDISGIENNTYKNSKASVKAEIKSDLNPSTEIKNTDSIDFNPSININTIIEEE